MRNGTGNSAVSGNAAAEFFVRYHIPWEGMGSGISDGIFKSAHADIIKYKSNTYLEEVNNE